MARARERAWRRRGPCRRAGPGNTRRAIAIGLGLLVLDLRRAAACSCNRSSSAVGNAGCRITSAYRSSDRSSSAFSAESVTNDTSRFEPLPRFAPRLVQLLADRQRVAARRALVEHVQRELGRARAGGLVRRGARIDDQVELDDGHAVALGEHELQPVRKRVALQARELRGRRRAGIRHPAAIGRGGGRLVLRERLDLQRVHPVGQPGASDVADLLDGGRFRARQSHLVRSLPPAGR